MTLILGAYFINLLKLLKILRINMFYRDLKIFKYLFFVLSLSMVGSTLLAQSNAASKSFREEFLNIKTNRLNSITENLNFGTQEKKSGFLAVCLSLILPGMGELYAGRFDAGQYSLTADAGLWLAFAGFNIYSNKIRDDGRSFARLHAGFSDENKDDDYYVNVSNFLNVYEYNDKKLRDRNSLKLYDPTSNMYFAWDSDENRAKFRTMRVHADEVLNNVKYISIALLANRILSCINAARFTGQYNKSLETSNPINMSVGLTNNNKNIDGFVINISRAF
jgi:hypothetical protein